MHSLKKTLDDHYGCDIQLRKAKIKSHKSVPSRINKQRDCLTWTMDKKTAVCIDNMGLIY